MGAFFCVWGLVPAGSVDGAAQELQQILLQHAADVLNVVRRKLGLVAESLGDVALRALDHLGKLRAANPMACHGKPHLVRDCTRKGAGGRLGF